MNTIKLIHGDCLEHLPTTRGVNLIVTSPPYNVDLGNNKYNKNGYNLYEDNKPYAEYLEFMRCVFQECYKSLAEDGRIAINIGDAKNGSIPTHSDFIHILSEVGFIPMTTIIWNKNNTSNRCAWGSYLSAKAPSFPRGFEYVLVFQKTKGLSRVGESTITKEEWVEYTNGLWTIAPERKQKEYGHPAMFPVELCDRLIKMLSYKGDLVLDPFCGVGTAGVSAITNGRDFIGIELSEDYLKVAEKRINEVKSKQLTLGV